MTLSHYCALWLFKIRKIAKLTISEWDDQKSQKKTTPLPIARPLVYISIYVRVCVCTQGLHSRNAIRCRAALHTLDATPVVAFFYLLYMLQTKLGKRTSTNTHLNAAPIWPNGKFGKNFNKCIFYIYRFAQIREEYRLVAGLAAFALARTVSVYDVWRAFASRMHLRRRAAMIGVAQLYTRTGTMITQHFCGTAHTKAQLYDVNVRYIARRDKTTTDRQLRRTESQWWWWWFLSAHTSTDRAHTTNPRSSRIATRAFAIDERIVPPVVCGDGESWASQCNQCVCVWVCIAVQSRCVYAVFNV